MPIRSFSCCRRSLSNRGFAWSREGSAHLDLFPARLSGGSVWPRSLPVLSYHYIFTPIVRKAAKCTIVSPTRQRPCQGQSAAICRLVEGGRSRLKRLAVFRKKVIHMQIYTCIRSRGFRMEHAPGLNPPHFPLPRPAAAVRTHISCLSYGTSRVFRL